MHIQVAVDSGMAQWKFEDVAVAVARVHSSVHGPAVHLRRKISAIMLFRPRADSKKRKHDFFNYRLFRVFVSGKKIFLGHRGLRRRVGVVAFLCTSEHASFGLAQRTKTECAAEAAAVTH